MEKTYQELEEERDIQENLAESFRKEALSWASIASSYKKDYDSKCKLLRKIKKIAQGLTQLCTNCEEQMEQEECNDLCNARRLREILNLINKDES